MSRHRLLLLLFLVLSLIAVGCGGGGGGGSSSSISVVTDWTANGTPGVPEGASVKIDLFGPNGALIDSKILNDNNSTQSVSFDGAGAGEHRLLISLFSSPNADGPVTGTIEMPVSTQSTKQLKIAVGKAVSLIRVAPSSLALTIPEAGRFYVVGYSSSDVATFTQPEDFEWTVLGGIATVNEGGLASAQTAGTGSVRARHIPTGLTASAALTVHPAGTRTGKWTVLVFMNAANDLSQFDTLNINQMERVAGNPDVRFVVQWKQAAIQADPNPSFIGTRRYLIKPDQTTAIASSLVQDLGSGVDMGSAETLRKFIEWGKTYYPADRYCLVIWNHGNGWRRSAEEDFLTRGVSYDDETGNRIDTWQLPQAISGIHWDILSWDASLMQMMEVAYEVRDQAKFVVGSEESPPGEGLPYDLVFKSFRDTPTATTATLTKSFVDGMLAVPGYSTRRITQSVVDTSKLGALRDSLSNLADHLIARREVLAVHIGDVRNRTQSYSLTSSRQYYDIGDLMDKLDSVTNDMQVASFTQPVRTALDQAVIWEGHNAYSPRSHGLSIDFSPGETFNNSSADNYARLRFAMDSRWDEWLKVAP